MSVIPVLSQVAWHYSMPRGPESLSRFDPISIPVSLESRGFFPGPLVEDLAPEEKVMRFEKILKSRSEG
jgi:hypothetical protein